MAEGSKSKYLGPDWKPLLLIVPLRLGLQEINPIYITGLQVIEEKAMTRLLCNISVANAP